MAEEVNTPYPCQYCPLFIALDDIQIVSFVWPTQFIDLVIHIVVP